MLSPDGGYIWDGKFWIPISPEKFESLRNKKIPDIGTAYLLNCLLPGIGVVYLGRIVVGMLVFLACLFFGLIFFNWGNLVFVILLWILTIAETRGDYSRCIKRLIK